MLTAPCAMKSTSSYLSLLLAASAITLSGVPAVGQSVRGRVIDQKTDAGVPDATVLLLNEAGIVRKLALSNSSGAYSLAAPASGTYTLRVDATGYNTLNTDPIRLAKGQSLDMDLRIWSLTELQPVVVTAEKEPFAPGPLEGFYERRETGRGHFITREEIEQKGAHRFTEIMRNAPSVAVVPLRGSPHYTVRIKGVMRIGRDCPPVLWVDNVRWGSIDLGDGPDRELFPSDIEGIEVYTPGQIPIDFSTSDAVCGVVVVWTKRAP